MSDVFISYARATAARAQVVAQALRALGYEVWRDDELPAHRPYAEVIEERVRAAKAVVVIWSAHAAKSHWVRAEATVGRKAGTLVQLRIDATSPPVPFNQIECADLSGWVGEAESPGWRKVVASVAELVGREAQPGARPQSASLALPTKPSIGVMAFANLSGDPQQDYFADGMVEEITSALSRIRSIFVIASGSTLSFKGKALTPQQIAAQLGVRYLLEGSVRKAADRVRISVGLIDATDGSQIWAERFEDTLEDVFALQDRVALGVAARIEPRVRDSEMRRARGRSTDHMGSYDLYLRARSTWQMNSKPAYFAALELLHRAIALDPDYGLAHAFASYCHAWVASNGWSEDPRSDRRQATDLAHRALQLSRDDPEALGWAAAALFGAGGDLDVSIDLTEQAIALNPGIAFTLYINGVGRLASGELEEGIARLEASMRLDPLADFRAAQLSWLGVGRMLQGRDPQAIRACEQAAQLTPDYPWPYLCLATIHGRQGDVHAGQEALAAYEKVTSRSPERWVRAFKLEAHRDFILEGVAMARGESRRDQSKEGSAPVPTRG